MSLIRSVSVKENSQQQVTRSNPVWGNAWKPYGSDGSDCWLRGFSATQGIQLSDVLG